MSAPMSRPITTATSGGRGDLALTNAPGPNRAVPFLPGMSYGLPGKKRFPKSHIFEFKVGVGRSLGVMGTEVDPMDRVITTTTNRTIMRDETTGSLIQTDFSKQAPFEPSFVGLEGKVLRFVADMTDAVPESLSEPYHERRFTIFYYLVDDSIQIVEQRKNNSGYMQGLFMKRHKVPRAANASAYNESEFVSLQDFAETDNIVIYGRVFLLTGCNQFTEEFYCVNGLSLSMPALEPEPSWREEQEQRQTATDVWKTGPVTTKRPDDFDSARLKPSQRAGYKRERFLKFNNKVLRFFGLWDDRKSMFGDKHFYTINYFLADDALEVLENHGKNEGRDPFPKLVKKSKVPKSAFGLQGIGVATDDVSDRAYIQDKDLQVGQTIHIYGRKILLYSCDAFTRHFYETAYDYEQPPDVQLPKELIEFPQQSEPPYQGFGTEEDSIASFYRLVPKGAQFDALKQSELDKVVFRWKAKLHMDNMEHAGPDDSKRRFVISFFMVDQTIAVYEPPVSNSGFVGGKFLERQRIRTHGTTKQDCKYITDKDMLQDLPHAITINNYPFLLLECDRFTLRYRNKGNIASLLSIDELHYKLQKNIGDMDGLFVTLQAAEQERDGVLHLDTFVQVLEGYETQLDEDEILALVHYWDKSQDGTVNYGEFVEALRSTRPQ